MFCGLVTLIPIMPVITLCSSDHISVFVSKERLNRADSLKRFQDVVEGRAPDQVVDDGRIPGDGKGAAGLDTSFFRCVSLCVCVCLCAYYIYIHIYIYEAKLDVNEF